MWIVVWLVDGVDIVLEVKRRRKKKKWEEFTVSFAHNVQQQLPNKQRNVL